MKIRRAEPADADFLVALLTHREVEPFLSARRANDRESLLAEIERSRLEPYAFGLFLIEVAGRPAGTVQFEVVNRRSRVVRAGGLAVHPDFRGRRLADEASRAFQRHLLLELGFHRIELEVYGFNERAMRHAERVGFVREGVKRKAYRRHGKWMDGILYGLVLEDLLTGGMLLLYEYVGRHNHGVRTGEWESLGECFAADAVLELEGAASGHFAGRAAIVTACRERPRDDELRVLDAAEAGGIVDAGYARASRPEVLAGRMLLTTGGDEIARLVVTLDGPRGSGRPETDPP